MNPAEERPEAALAVRLAALVAGLGVGGWAALATRTPAPLLTLSILGALAAVSVSGTAPRRPCGATIVLMGGIGLAALLPLIALAGAPAWLGLAQFVFGAFAATLDATARSAADVIRRQGHRPIRGGLHAPRAVGVLAGAVLVTLLQSVGFEPVLATLILSAAMTIAAVVAWPYMPAASRPA
jgi:hypothetical protein